jgi:flavin reductase (DIM6/NTAB) family NADH-FMN oxidoreductase RutF
MDEKEVVINFLERCVNYSDDSIIRKRQRGDVEDIPRWQAYRDFTAYAISEIKDGKLDPWFRGEEVEISSSDESDESEQHNFSMKTLEHQERANLLDGLVAPRPVFVAATCNSEGVHNLGLLSTVSVASNSPALLTCSLSQDRNGRPRDTLMNLRQDPTIKLHLMRASLDATKVAEAAARAVPREVSEWESLNATPPNLPASLATLHCRMLEEHALPNAVATLCIFEVESISISKELGDDIIKGGKAETLYQHGWCHLHPSDADWSHLIH